LSSFGEGKLDRVKLLLALLLELGDFHRTYGENRELAVRDLVADRRDFALEGLADATSNRLVLRQRSRALASDRV
jgi:hypothetical protein